MSGNEPAPGRDPFNKFSVDQGATWAEAFIVPKCGAPGPWDAAALNGVVFGQQPPGALFPNFQGPAGDVLDRRAVPQEVEQDRFPGARLRKPDRAGLLGDRHLLPLRRLIRRS